MKLSVKEISENEFSDSSAILLFSDPVSDRKYGILNEINYKLAWQSDLISPTLTEITPGIIAIGIDQNFAVVEVAKSSPVIKLTLDYPYCTTEVFGNHIFVTSQLEIIKIDTANWSIVKKYELPEYFESMTPKGSGYEVHCMEDIVLDII